MGYLRNILMGSHRHKDAAAHKSEATANLSASIQKLTNDTNHILKELHTHTESIKENNTAIQDALLDISANIKSQGDTTTRLIHKIHPWVEVICLILSLIATVSSCIVSKNAQKTADKANKIAEQAFLLQQELAKPIINTTYEYDERLNQIHFISIHNDGGQIANYKIKVVPCFRIEYLSKNAPGSPFPYDLFVENYPINILDFGSDGTYAPICRLNQTESHTGLLGTIKTSDSLDDYLYSMESAIAVSNEPDASLQIRSISLEYYIRIVYNDMNKEQHVDYYHCATGCYRLNDSADVALPIPAEFNRELQETAIDDAIHEAFYASSGFNLNLAPENEEDAFRYLYDHLSYFHSKRNP